MQLSEDAQGILQPERHFCDLPEGKILPSAMLEFNTGLHSRAGKTVFSPFCRMG